MEVCSERYEGCPCAQVGPHDEHECEHGLPWRDFDDAGEVPF
jgi:hypothetical protein